MDSKHTIELIGSTFELAGVAVLVIGSVLSFVRYIVSLHPFSRWPGGVSSSASAPGQIDRARTGTPGRCRHHQQRRYQFPA